MTPSLPPPPALAPGQTHLRIMATSDLHMALRAYNYLADAPRAGGAGLAGLARIMRRLRVAAENTLYFDNGDLLQGGPMGDLCMRPPGGPGTAPGPHPAVAALNALQADAMALGNHEFDYGCEALARALGGARFPVLAANLRLRGADAGLRLRPFVLLCRRLRDREGRAQDCMIGVMGLLPPQVVAWNAHHLAGRGEVEEIIACARRTLAEMRAAGADVVIALCHSGIALLPGGEPENVATELARLPGIDALVAGHSHRAFPGPGHEDLAGADCRAGLLHGTPCVLPPPDGAALGLLDLVLERRAGGWRVMSGSGRLCPACGDGEDPAIGAITDAAHAAVLAHVREPVGATLSPLHSHFAALGHAPALEPVLEAQRRAAALALAGGRSAELPVLAAAAPLRNGGIEGAVHAADVPPGPVLRRHVAGLYGFANRLAAVEVTGAGLRAWLERAASVFSPLVPGESAPPLLLPGAAAYNLDAVSGVDYVIDLTRPPAYDPRGAPTGAPGRIVMLSHAGVPVAADARFVVATNSYRAQGGGGFPGLPGAPVLHLSEEGVEEIVARHISDSGPLRASGRPLWRFAPAGGATAWIETAPTAAAHAGAMPWLALEPCHGAGPERQLRFSVRL